MFLISISGAIAIANINIILAFFLIINTSSILALAKKPLYINYKPNNLK